MKKAFLVCVSFLLTSCFQVTSNGDEDLRTTPVTNNPLLIPSSGGGMGGPMPHFPR